MSKLIILIVIFANFTVHAQMTGASLFPEMRAVNPAVLGQREQGIFSFHAQKDKIEKEQNLELTFGAGTKGTSEIDINQLTLFYGGKKGGLITTEFTVNKSTGEKKDTLTSTTENVSSNNDVSSTYVNASVALGRFLGVSFGKLDFDYKNTMNATFQGSPINSSFQAENSATIMKAGLMASFIFNYGIYYEHGVNTSDRTLDGVKSQVEDKLKRAGVGIGTSGKTFRFEFSYEKELDDQNFNGKTYTPNRTSFAFELKLGKLSIGYTGRYYKDGYFELEKMLYYNLAYANNFDKARLENTINFSLGQSKGHSFGGSASYSKVQSSEDGSIFKDNNKHPTETKSLGISAKYGYSF